MGMDLLYHAFEKVGDLALSGNVTTAFAAGAPVGLNAVDGGVQIASAENNVIGLAKVTRAAMAAAGPTVGATTYGTASVVTGVCIVELYDNSAVDAADTLPMAAAVTTYTWMDKLYAAGGVWTETAPGGGSIPYGQVLVISTASNLGGVVAYFNFIAQR